MKKLLGGAVIDFPVKSSAHKKSEPEKDSNQMPKQILISYLAQASESHLLNPAFLLGIDLNTPFLSPVQFDQLELELESAAAAAAAADKEHEAKTAVSDYSSGPRRSFSSSSTSSSTPNCEHDDRLVDIQLVDIAEPPPSAPNHLKIGEFVRDEQI